MMYPQRVSENVSQQTTPSFWTSQRLPVRNFHGDVGQPSVPRSVPLAIRKMPHQSSTCQKQEIKGIRNLSFSFIPNRALKGSSERSKSNGKTVLNCLAESPTPNQQGYLQKHIPTSVLFFPFWKSNMSLCFQRILAQKSNIKNHIKRHVVGDIKRWTSRISRIDGCIDLNDGQTPRAIPESHRKPTVNLQNELSFISYGISH